MGTISTLIYQAYGPYAPWQLVWPKGRPDALYDVSATMPKGTTPERLHLMFQSLLADRFKCRAHWQPKNMPAYALEVSPRGLKIHKAGHPPGRASTVVMDHSQTFWYMFRREPEMAADPNTGRVARTHVFTMAELADVFRPGQLMFEDLPLVDQTGLDGYYEFDLRVPCDPEGCFTRLRSDDVFFEELEKQPGLRVEKKTLSTKVLIVDHVNRNPAPN